MKKYNRRQFLVLALIGLALAGCGKLEEKVKETQTSGYVVISVLY